jgi:homogentisate 1,2-dioxygenase
MIERRAHGLLPPKHHTALRGDGGALMYEECLTREGFDGPYTIMYHLRAPHSARPTDARLGSPPVTPAPPRPLRRRHYKTQGLTDRQGAAVSGRHVLLFNDDVAIATLFPNKPDPAYFANGDGDDLFFILKGSGLLRTVLGDVAFSAGDYVAVPRGLIHRFIPDKGIDQHWLCIECAGGLYLPKQWRNEHGQLRMDAPFCHRDFRGPVFEGPRDEGLRDIVVKRQGRFDAFAYDESPLDVVGWDGSVYPFVFPIRAFQPRVGLVHLPPTWHGTFATRGALVCSFVPRPLDFHAQAIPCPYPHSSVDCDEVLFYCDGNFTSRKGVGAGSLSHHPAGIPHGPHPGAYEGSLGSKETSELAVMLDTFKPLQTNTTAVGVEDTAYHDSFR